MRGIENLIAMRKAGMKPAFVWVEMLPMQQWTKKLTQSVSRHVDIHMGQPDIDRVTTIDLRALVGLNVLVNGPANDSTEKVAMACLNAGAKTVQAFFYDLSRHEYEWLVKGMRFSKEGVKTVWQQ